MRKILVLALLAVMVGCQKKEQVQSGNSDQLNSANSSRHEKGKSNPFEQIGINHNAVVGAYMDFVKSKGDTTRKARVDFIRTYNREHLGIEVKCSVDPSTVKVTRDYLVSIAKENKYQDESAAFLAGIWDVVESIATDGNFDRMYGELLSLEASIAQLKVPQQERDCLYKVIAIARYSSLLWKKHIIDSPVKPNAKSIFSRLLGAAMVIHADITGAMVGVFFLDPDGFSEEFSSWGWTGAYIMGLG